LGCKNVAELTQSQGSACAPCGDNNGINAAGAVIFNSGTISGINAGSIGINANMLVLTNFASGLITGDGFGVSGSQNPNLTVTNFGTICATGLGGFALLGSVVNLVNFGTLTSASGSGGIAVQLTNGNIVNNAGGVISGDIGIGAFGNTSIFNAGTITGNGGAAITFSSGGNTLTLGPGYVINGTARGFGADTFQLGGVGTGTFDASLLLSQFSGYATFNKVGSSTWILTGTNATAMPWHVNAGTLDVEGAVANATMTVNSGATLTGAGTVGATTVASGGILQPGNGTIGTSLAWAHDYDTDRNIGATFQTLPGASFVVNGAAPAPDSALTTASVEMKWLNHWSAGATFEGEFSNVTTSYAGKGVVRYVW
jgi:hypothetical protein